MSKKITFVNLVLDRSGSMQSVQQETIDGYNTYIKKLKAQKNPIRFTLTQFDSTEQLVTDEVYEDQWSIYDPPQFIGNDINNIPIDGNCRPLPKKRPTKYRYTRSEYRPMIEEVYRSVPVGDVPLLDSRAYNPRGGTPLLDAIGHAIKTMENDVKRVKSPNVLMVIVTDGYENSSRDYTGSHISDLIKAKENEGWTFVYLGANQDAWEVAKNYGFAMGNTVTYSASGTGMKKSFDGLTTLTSYYASVGHGSSMNNVVLDAGLTTQDFQDESTGTEP